jgi:hypothetical protein
MAAPSLEATPELVVGVVVAVVSFLIVSVLAGFLGRRKAKSFEHRLVGHGDIEPLITGFALVASYRARSKNGFYASFEIWGQFCAAYLSSRRDLAKTSCFLTIP